MEKLTIHIKKDDRCFKKGTKFSLDLVPGDVNFIVGPNGSGKTTLIHYIRAMRHDLSDINRELHDGMSNQEDRLYSKEIGKLYEVTGLDAYSGVFVLDAIDDDPTSFLNSSSAHALVMGGGLRARSLSKGQKAWDMITRFLDKISKVTGFSPEDYRSGRKYKKHPLIIMDETDEGLDLRMQRKYYTLLRNIATVWNATVLCVCHNVMAMGIIAGAEGKNVLDFPVYDISTRTTKSFNEYIKEQAGVEIDIKLID